MNQLENQVKNRRQTTAYGSVLLAGALWGLMGMWNRFLMAGGLSPLSIVAVRNFGGAIILVLFVAVKDRSIFRIEKAHIKYFLGSGLGGTLLCTMCYFSCQKYCSLAVASILMYTAPAIVIVVSAALWKEKITRQKIVALGLTLVGCALVCGIGSGNLSATGIGVVLGLASGLTYALYTVFGRYALKYYSSITVVVWNFIIAGPASLLLLDPTEAARAFSHPILCLTAVCLAAFSTAAPYLLYTWGLSKIEAGKASILASMEPVMAALVGIIIFQESMGIPTAIGILLVLAGVYILR
jgi:DME family drug/metabolite transporter